MKKIIAGLLIAVVALLALPALSFTGKNAHKTVMRPTVKKAKSPVRHPMKKAQPPDPWGKTGTNMQPAAGNAVHRGEKTEPPDPWDKTGTTAQPTAGSAAHPAQKAQPPDPWGKTGAHMQPAIKKR